MKHSLLFIITIIVSTFSLQAQNKVDRSNYKLLWEITGNGFEKPSYLFGSMHVEDERVFEFCDSMLVCLENSEGFSAELNLDSMIHFVMKAMFSEDTTNILRDILSPEAYQGLNNKLLNKEGKGIDDLSNKQPWIIEMMLNEDREESDSDFESALDMYLYNYAKKLGKETYGLEKIEDQLSLSLLKYETYQEYLADSNPDTTNTGNSNDVLEELTQIYISGDINVINDVFVKPMPDDIYKRKLLTDRNVVMADNIELLGQQMGMFNVVGAAHLPGEMGVIELLKKKGFHVRPVSPDFTGKSQFKDLSHVELPWKTLDRKAEMECALAFPVDAVRIETIEGSDMSAYDYFISMDLQTQELYMYLGIDAERELKEDEIEDLLDLGLESVLEAEEGEEIELIKAPYNIEYKGMKGRGVKAKSTEGTIDARAFVQGSKMYYLYVLSQKGDVKNQERFFNSLEFYPTVIESVTGKVVLEDYALSFDAPIKMKHSRKEQYQLDEENEEYPYPSIIHKYEGSDKLNDVYYSVQLYDMPEGMYTVDENVVLDGMVNNMDAFGMTNMKENEKEILSKINRKEYSFEKEGMFTSIGYFLRGSRFLTVFVATDSEEKAKQKYERFVSSIYLLDFKKTEFVTQEIKEAGISVKLPKNSHKESEDYDNYPYEKETYQITATDTSSTAVFLLEAMEVSPYHEIENVDTFLLSLYEDSVEDMDGIEDLEFVKYKGYPSLQFDLSNSQQTSVISKMRIILVENWVIYAVVHLPRELNNSPYSDLFLNSIKIDPLFKRKKLAENKINKIAEDISTTDSEIYGKLQDAIFNYDIKEQDLSAIYTILKKEIPLDTSTIYYYSIKEQLIKELEDINDKNTITVLKEIFPSSSMKEQLAILNIVARVEEGSLKNYWELMNQIDTDHEDFNPSITIQHFYDNLSAVVDNMNEIMTLSQINTYSNDIFFLLYTLSNEADINWKEAALPYQKDMLSLLERNFLEWKPEKGGVNSSHTSLMQYLIIIQSKLPDNEGLYVFLEKNIIDAESYLATQMAGILLQNNIELNDEIWNKIEAEHLTYAVIDDVANEDNEYHRHPLIPKKYKNQTHAAKMGLITYFEDNYDIKDINFIRKEKIKKDGDNYNLYIFEMKGEYYSNERIIGVSLQPSNKKEYKLYPIYYDYGFYEKEGFDLEQSIKELMEEFFE